MHSLTFSLKTGMQMELVDITDTVQRLLSEHPLQEGFCYLFNPHTTAGLTINEGADPDVRRDLIGAFRRIVPLDMAYRHAEGNSPSHVMATLTGCSLQVAISGGRLVLGTWQRIFFCEFDGPRTRTVHMRIY